MLKVYQNTNWISLPVLSEQITLHAPNVSMHSSFFTKQFLFAILLAVRLIQATRHTGIPSGTFAIIIAMKNEKLLKKPYPMNIDMMKNVTPMIMAKIVTTFIKWFNSLWISVSDFVNDVARPAILPKKKQHLIKTIHLDLTYNL